MASCAPTDNDDLKFFVNWKSYDVNIDMFWVSFSGTQMKAEDYEYKLKIENLPENRAKEWYLFSGKRGCVSCDVSGEDMKEKGDVVFLNKALLERAAIENDGQFIKFNYTLFSKIILVPKLYFGASSHRAFINH